MILILKPLPARTLRNFKHEADRAHLATHRAALVHSGPDRFGHWTVEEVKTGRVFPVEAKHLKQLHQCSLKVRAYLAQA